MDSRAAAAANGGRADSHNMLVIKEAFRAFAEGGTEAGLETLLSYAHTDCEFRPYSASGRVLRGADEIRAHFREACAEGTAMQVRAARFQEADDEVVVSGSIRTTRPGGGFAESQLSWTYRFRGGLLEEARWSPHA